MSLARLVLTATTVEGRSKSEVAREYGCSRRWVQKLSARYADEGEAAFEARSRRPHLSPSRTPYVLEDEIVEIRKHLVEEGLDGGAQTIAYHLARRGANVPSASTIWRILVRRGFITPEPHKRPRSSIIRFAADQPNERWQADVTHWRLRGGREVEIFNQLDDHSRLLVGSDARTTFKAADVVVCFEQASQRYGVPACYLTDNAAVFTGSYRQHGWVALERELVSRGVLLRHSRPYHPQTCGKVERFHQTLKQWLAKHPRARSIPQLQAQLEVFAEYYNTIRPHRSVGRRPPIEAYLSRPKAVAHGGPLPATHFRTRRDVVDSGGSVTLRYNSRLYHIGIGRRHSGRRIVLLVHDLNVRILTEDGQVLRALVLDPKKVYQARG